MSTADHSGRSGVHSPRDSQSPRPIAAVHIGNKPSPHSRRNKLGRVAWGLVEATAFRWSPRPLHGWRRFLLRAFGAQLAPGAKVLPKATVWGPWNLRMGENATIGDHVDVYCVDRIDIGDNTTISQYSYLCGATHDHEHPRFPLVPKPISIGSSCWLAADCFVGPGVRIGDGTVVGARSTVVRDLPEWSVCAGSPAKPHKARRIGEATAHENLPPSERNHPPARTTDSTPEPPAAPESDR
jgi:putative colanic acid biosynthesis acetyltransferase WcaF